MFDLKVFCKYTDAKEALKGVELVRGYYKSIWAEADAVNDNNIMDETDVRLSELDVMQVEIEKTLNDYKEFLAQ